MRRPRIAIGLAAALVGALAVTGPVAAAETTLTATLSGGMGTDTDGSGSATVVLDPDAGTACWKMAVMSIAPVTVSHIHEGAEGVSGGVVVDLDLDGFETTSEGCTTGVAAATLQAIIANPAGYYVNVHNADFPGGAIRGQLSAGTPDTALPASGSPLVGVGLLLLGLAGGWMLALATRGLRSRG